MRKLEALLLAAVIAALPSMALADGAGSALGVKQQAAARLGQDTRTLVVGSDIFIGDLVQTGAQGQVQIKFADNTELVPSSTFDRVPIYADGRAPTVAAIADLRARYWEPYHARPSA